MSFNRLNSDTCQYKQLVHESVGPGDYMLSTPPNGCDYCYPWAPTVRLQYGGDSIDRSRALVDINSELLNINKPASKCPEKRWVSQNVKNGYKFNNSTRKSLKNIKEDFSNPSMGDNRCNSKDGNLTNWKDCFYHSIESRYVTPASTLRGTGFDRWEWLCFNPQEKAAIPFDCYIPNRIVVKDNHRPCIPTPIDYRPLLPVATHQECEKTTPVCANPTNPRSINCKVSPFYV